MVALVTALAALGVGGFALTRTSRKRTPEPALLQRSAPPARVPPSLADLRRDDLLTSLNSRVKDLEEQLEVLRQEAGRDDGAANSGAFAPEPPHAAPATPAWNAGPRRDNPGAGAVAMSATRVIPGVLTDDDRVHATESSRPMVEIRWPNGGGSAQVWVNREYKFGESTVGYLHSAFDVDGAGPGAYETILPAEVEWSADATTGRVLNRGRVRAIGG